LQRIKNNNSDGLYFDVLMFFGYGRLGRRRWRTTLMKKGGK
jgi:hypothetical protein